MHGHAWNLCLFRQTVKKKVGQTYVTGASGQGPPMWQVAGGMWHVAGAYIADVICHAAPLPLSLSLSLSRCVLSLI